MANIRRTDPPDNVVVYNFEPNFMPLVEFHIPSLPWDYSRVNPDVDPSSSDSEFRHTPVVSLITLKGEKEGQNTEFTFQTNNPASAGVITVDQQGGYLPLPDLNEAWSWAHVQVSTDKSELSQEEMKSKLTYEPDSILSRVICPRKLEPNTYYHVFLVFTFKASNEAAIAHLNESTTPTYPLDDSQTTLEKSWNAGDPSVDLFYLKRWEFQTGEKGDFEYLVRLLEPRVLDSRVGI